MDKAYLILADGTIYEGESIGLKGESIGQVVFTTTMGGFSETLCDNRFFGQIVVQTFPIVGSYGFVASDNNNQVTPPVLRGYVVRELANETSNFRMDGSLDDYLKANSIVGIQGIDTRALTKKLRDSGSMNGMISQSKGSIPSKLKMIQAYKIECPSLLNSEEKVGEFDGGLNVAVWDFGYADAIVKMLSECKINVTRLKGIDAVQRIFKGDFDGVIISDGGGNLWSNTELILEVKKLADSNKKILGIGLGHLLLAAANGLSIKQLKQDHRGSNHPVRALKRDVSFVTGHNHSHTVVVAKGKSDVFEVDFVSLNDKSCEGISYKDKPQISVQFDIDSKGARFIFDEFISSLKGEKNA